MASHTENSCHDDSFLTSDSVHVVPNSQPITGLHYTNDDLLKLKPIKDNNLTGHNNPFVIIEKQPSVAMEDEKLQGVKPDPSQGMAEVEPRGDDKDNELDEIVVESKKKKKKSSGKNKKKQEPPNGFEGKSLPATTLYFYLIWHYRIFRGSTHHAGGV